MIPTPTNGDISLYFHVPFCTKKCHYCHFFVLPNRPHEHENYLKALKLEWLMRFESLKNTTIKSVYFGGGTPALLHPDHIAEILSWIPIKDPIEITIEANPENITHEKFALFRKAGINRLSIGAQTFDDALLPVLGRLHTAKETIQALDSARKADFENISIDLMYDLPGQSKDSWLKTLKIAKELPITHLSLYNLTIEPETLFFKKRNELAKSIPDQELSLEMFNLAHEILPSCGLIPYEISAFAKNGSYSRHNVGYWMARPFLGYGPSAFSYFNNVRFRNIPHFGKYQKALEEGLDPSTDYDNLSQSDRRKELLAVELRLRQGVDLKGFQERHGLLDMETSKAIAELIKMGWLEQKSERLFLSPQGILFYDSLASELI